MNRRTNTFTLLPEPMESCTLPFIEILIGSEKGKKHVLNKAQLTIGRSPENNIPCPSEAVSRIHAILISIDNCWHIRDNNSKNGIQINGNHVTEATLKDGDLVQIGDFFLRFTEPALLQKPPPPKRISKSSEISKTQSYNSIWGASGFLLIVFGTGLFLYFSKTEPVLENTVVNLETSNPPYWDQITAPSDGAHNPSMINLARQALTDTTDKTTSPATEAKIKPEVVRNPSKQDLNIKKKPKPSNAHEKLDLFIKEGQYYLAEGDFNSAAIAFNFALLTDPNNPKAHRGLELAGKGIPIFIDDPPRSGLSAPRGNKQDKPQIETSTVNKTKSGINNPALRSKNKELVLTLLSIADTALNNKKYQKAIEKAEEARQIEISGETTYLNQAKQIIDKAKIAQKEEFIPFMEQANSLFVNKAFRASRELCQEMLKRDDSYSPARECVDKAESQMKMNNDQGAQ